MEICFATNNPHKISEISAKVPFKLLSLEDVGCYEELPETAPTIEGNSLQKAFYLWTKYKVICFADDTGLEVEALNGEPGVYSARYAGVQKNAKDNIRLLLQNLSEKANRKARFKTVITLVLSEKEIHQFEGIVDGEILLQESDGVEGFGYDPIFRPLGYNKTFAQMSIEEKNEISHRGRAVKKLLEFLNKIN